MTDGTGGTGSGGTGSGGTGTGGTGSGDGPAEAVSRSRRRHDVARTTLRAWHAFRAWRQARPFWAGVVLIVAGAELLLIPLPIHAMGLILHIGTGGVLGILIGVLLLVCALLIWISPVQRAFYSIVAVLLAIAALVASNLGGFLIGTLLGVLGGSLGFGWAPHQPGTQASRGWPRRRPAGPEDAEEGITLAARGTEGTAVKTSVLPLLIAAAAVLQITNAPAAADQGQRPTGCFIWIPFICPWPTPSPTPSGVPGPAASPGPAGPGPTPSTGTPQSPGLPSPGASPRNGSDPTVGTATAPASLTASSAVITGFAYDGLVTVPTASGTVRMMQFSMNAITLTGMRLVAGSGTAITTQAPTASLSGHVTLYATRLSGSLLGVHVTITPGSALSAILAAIAPLTRAIPVPMTDVAVTQPYTSGDGMTITGLRIS